MKKLSCILLLLLLLLLVGTVTFAADNQSAAWVRTLCREAVTDSIDASYFNPAGTAYLAGTIWDTIGPQYVFLSVIAIDLLVRVPLLIGMPETLRTRED